MKRFVSLILILICMMFAFSACNNKSELVQDSVKNKDWNSILSIAKGTTVNFYGWGGSEQTNKWIDNYLSKELKEKYDINLKRIPMDIDDILNKLLGEKQANSTGTIDVVWINGENFYTAKKNNLLYGPFTDNLPNYNKYVDKNSKEMKYDFGFPIDGYEAPYGKSQFVIAYDTSKIKEIPNDHKQLLEFVKANPGKFTYPAPPDFTGSVFVRNIIYDIVGSEKFVNMKPDRSIVEKEIQPAIDYLKELKPYLWNKGITYPSNISMLDKLYSDGQILNTMTYSPNSIIEKIRINEFTHATKLSGFRKGNIGNTHFLAIPFNSNNKAGALATINCILSFEAQNSKYEPDTWGDLPIFDVNKLNDEEKEKFKTINKASGLILQQDMLKNRLSEMPAELVPIIEKIWLENIPKED